MNDEKKPVKGDTFKCEKCGMEILITEPCECDEGEPSFSCCGEQMEKMNSLQ